MALGGVSSLVSCFDLLEELRDFHYEALFGIRDSRSSCQSGFSYDLAE
jgi:hypothetical protein